MHDMQQQCVWYPSVRDMGEGVSSKEECMDAWDLLGMLDLKGGKTARKSWCMGFELPVLAPTLSSVGSMVHSGMWVIHPCGLQMCCSGW
jgi:hypothetical protein